MLDFRNRNEHVQEHPATVFKRSSKLFEVHLKLFTSIVISF